MEQKSSRENDTKVMRTKGGMDNNGFSYLRVKRRILEWEQMHKR